MKVSITALNNNDRKYEKQLETEWANAIKSRDNWSCVVCGSQYKPNAHHIVPREHKQFKFSLDNGITLCIKHHKFSRALSAHNSPLAFFLWLQRFKSSLFAVASERSKLLALGEAVI